jgi:hypothetical protein
MTPRRTLTLIVTPFVVAIASRSLAAQAPAPATPISSAATAPAVTHWSQHPTGKYRLQLALPDHMMDADLTIADSAGSPTAVFWPVGDNEGHPVAVAVKDTDLVLSASTPRGPYTLVHQRKGDQLSGHFSMGVEEAGAVQGHVEREAAQR